jgi:EAL domain-containing protein (putative c-di-GMP-specific phosphodiesterase class I)
MTTSGFITVPRTRVRDAQQARNETAPLPERLAEVPSWEEPVEQLEQALQQNKLELYAQRVVALDNSQRFPMAEVFVRLREEDERLLPPDTFLPAFERCGMMPELDRWVVRQVVAGLARGSRMPCFAVNVSAQTLSDADFISYVAAELGRQRVAPASIVLEVTEEAALARPASIAEFAAAARGIGCGLTIDSFGGSEASWLPVEVLRPNYVKVDRAVVHGLETSQTARSKLDAIVKIGRKIGIGVIGEWVESDAMLAYLRSAGAGFAQGYGVHMPAPIDSVLGNTAAPR